ncbi:hypothetical protein AURDEDRAFT_115616 [Auricularia subglabra TFB-10046 SS5]|nr:hypothetical protein AURDEDRAFT_115616 [Auricularia subglabra TFB-10046 SS5]
MDRMGSLDINDGHDMNDMASSGYYSTQLTIDDYLPQPLDYHLYTQTMPPRMVTDPQRPHIPGYFMSEFTRDMLLRRAQLTRAAPPPGAFALPEEVSGYHSLVPIENIAPERRRTFGPHHGTVYRAVKTTDGLCYALRRVENYRLTHEQAFSALEPWTHIRHPNIVSVREGFTTRAFNDDSLVVVYDFHADSQTLAEKYARPRTAGRRGHQQDQIVPEQTMWSFIIQIANALKAVHDRGLAMRTIDITKIIHSGKNRLRVGTCGVFDMLLFNQIQDTQLNQQEDLVQFGKVIFQLACNNVAATNNLPKAIEALTRHYSPDLKNVALFLISKPSPLKTVGQLFDMIGSRLLTEMDAMQDYADQLESDLMSELENGRLVRLLCKFGFINERPEFDMDPRWSETGERYPIKLFRDYVFHQVDERGNPHLNLAHVITCLNKLDAGSEERIMLTSREEQNCLVITYKEIKACLEAAFGELSRPR